ncbi:hypothetical protein KI387_013213, partial [Taxus chinensis]
SGTVGTNRREGREKPKELRANGNVPHVFASKRDRGARIGRIRGICPRKFGTPGLKIREGREKPAGPQMNQEMPRVIMENIQNFKGQ